MKKLKSLKDIPCDFEEINGVDLQNTVKEWIKHAEKQMKIFDESDREQYNFWAGYRMAFIDFFDIED